MMMILCIWVHFMFSMYSVSLRFLLASVLTCFTSVISSFEYLEIDQEPWILMF